MELELKIDLRRSCDGPWGLWVGPEKTKRAQRASTSRAVWPVCGFFVSRVRSPFRASANFKLVFFSRALGKSQSRITPIAIFTRASRVLQDPSRAPRSRAFFSPLQVENFKQELELV